MIRPLLASVSVNGLATAPASPLETTSAKSCTIPLVLAVTAFTLTRRASTVME